LITSGEQLMVLKYNYAPRPCVPETALQAHQGIAPADEVLLFPNPAEDELFIKTDEDAYDRLSIATSIGQVRIRRKIGSDKTGVSVKTLPAGIYYITLSGQRGSVVKKFVKM
jgi:type IX secretion system substrate protein